jgi:hypothetical protein
MAACPLTPSLLGLSRPRISRALGAALWALPCRFERADQIRFCPSGSRGHVPEDRIGLGVVVVLQETRDREEIVARVAALDIGKEEVVCCVRVPAERPGGGRR